MPVITQLTKQFEQKYPNVKINLTFKDFNSLVAVVNRALASDNGPDITEGNQGYQIDAEEVKAKLIIPLDKYVAGVRVGQVVGARHEPDLPVDAWTARRSARARPGVSPRPGRTSASSTTRRS